MLYLHAKDAGLPPLDTAHRPLFGWREDTFLPATRVTVRGMPACVGRGLRLLPLTTPAYPTTTLHARACSPPAAPPSPPLAFWRAIPQPAFSPLGRYCLSHGSALLISWTVYFVLRPTFVPASAFTTCRAAVVLRFRRRAAFRLPHFLLHKFTARACAGGCACLRRGAAALAAYREIHCCVHTRFHLTAPAPRPTTPTPYTRCYTHMPSPARVLRQRTVRFAPAHWAWGYRRCARAYAYTHARYTFHRLHNAHRALTHRAAPGFGLPPSAAA